MEYRADGRFFKTKMEADRVNAEKDLRHLLRMVMYPGVCEDGLACRMEDFAKEFEVIFKELQRTNPCPRR